jgi:lysophospholipase L1-like esterase
MNKLIMCCVGLAATLVSAACDRSNDATGPTPIPPANSTIIYTPIGASDAIGWGSSVPCFPFQDCPTGRGYVQVAERELKSRGFSVTVNPLGLPGAVLSRRVQNLATQYGREALWNLMEQAVPFVQRNTTLVTIFTGGNDVNTITSALGGGAGGTDRVGYINSQVAAFGQDFTAALQLIRETVPSARIVVLNLPNMGAMPFLANASRDQRLAAQMLSVGMTRSVFNPLTSTGVLVVDLMCDARAYQPSTYSSDGFHPGDTGYAWIAAEIVTAATSAYRAPTGSCPQMTLVN